MLHKFIVLSRYRSITSPVLLHTRYTRSTHTNTGTSHADTLLDTSTIQPYTSPQPSNHGSLYWPHTLLKQPLYNTLSIETTCDDTCVSIITSNRVILSNISLSQHQLVKQYNGVHPGKAAELHKLYLPIICELALKHANITDVQQQIQCIGIAVAPGLAPCLHAGLSYAKQLSIQYNIPLIGINHVESHAVVASLLDHTLIYTRCLILLLTGGHTQIWYQHSIGQYDIIGDTVDDAIGECLDKCTRLLLPLISESNQHIIGSNPVYGAICEYLAQSGDELRYTLTVPYDKNKICNFSFAGLKTQFLRLVESIKIRHCDSNNKLSSDIICDLAASLQYTVYQQLQQRLVNAIKYYVLIKQKPNKLILCGGVASNKYINNKLCELLSFYNMDVITPPPVWATDNSIMIGWNASIKYALGQIDSLDIVYEPKMNVGRYIDSDTITQVLSPPKLKAKQKLKRKKQQRQQ